MKKTIFLLLLSMLLLCLFAFGVSAAEDGEPNDTAQTATEIPLNGSVTGVCTYFDEKDWYKFTVTENGYFSISFTHELFPDYGEYWGIYLYNSAFAPVDGSTDFLGNYKTVRANQNWHSASYGVMPGTYYLRVSVHGNHGAVNQEYTVNVYFTAEDGWEKEYNSAMANADPLSFASPIRGTISTAGDNDWFSFTLSEATELILHVSHLTTIPNGNSWYIELYNEHGTRVFQSAEDALQGASTEVKYSAQAGKYYLHLNAKYGYASTAPYLLSVSSKHECAGEFVITKLPTCTEAGEQEKRCSTCGKSMERKAAPALGHQSDHWTIDAPATCTSAGQHHGFCDRCQKDVTESIPMLPHALGEAVHASGSKLIPPIVMEQTCSVCGHVAQTKDWSYVWIPILVLVGVVAVVIGLIGYAKAFKKK